MADYGNSDKLIQRPRWYSDDFERKYLEQAKHLDDTLIKIGEFFGGEKYKQRWEQKELAQQAQSEQAARSKLYGSMSSKDAADYLETIAKNTGKINNTVKDTADSQRHNRAQEGSGRINQDSAQREEHSRYLPLKATTTALALGQGIDRIFSMLMGQSIQRSFFEAIDNTINSRVDAQRLTQGDKETTSSFRTYARAVARNYANFNVQEINDTMLDIAESLKSADLNLIGNVYLDSISTAVESMALDTKTLARNLNEINWDQGMSKTDIKELMNYMHILASVSPQTTPEELQEFLSAVSESLLRLSPEERQREAKESLEVATRLLGEGMSSQMVANAGSILSDLVKNDWIRSQYWGELAGRVDLTEIKGLYESGDASAAMEQLLLDAQQFIKARDQDMSGLGMDFFRTVFGSDQMADYMRFLSGDLSRVTDTSGGVGMQQGLEGTKEPLEVVKNELKDALDSVVGWINGTLVLTGEGVDKSGVALIQAGLDQGYSGDELREIVMQQMPDNMLGQVDPGQFYEDARDKYLTLNSQDFYQEFSKRAQESPSYYNSYGGFASESLKILEDMGYEHTSGDDLQAIYEVLLGVTDQEGRDTVASLLNSPTITGSYILKYLNATNWDELPTRVELEDIMYGGSGPRYKEGVSPMQNPSSGPNYSLTPGGGGGAGVGYPTIPDNIEVTVENPFRRDDVDNLKKSLDSLRTLTSELKILLQDQFASQERDKIMERGKKSLNRN